MKTPKKSHFKHSIWMAAFFAIAMAITGNGWAAELKPTDILAAHKIIILNGTFDPITKRHIDIANDALAESGANIAILIPTKNPIRTMALPYFERQKMLELALGDDSRLLYLGGEKGLSRGLTRQGLIRKITALNPQAKIQNEWGGFVDNDLDAAKSSLSSSEKARNLLRDNLEVYFSDHLGEETKVFKAKRQLDSVLPVAVLDHILNKGLYIDRLTGASITTSARIHLFLQRQALSVLDAFHAYDRILKPYLVSRIANKNMTQLTLPSGESLKLKKYLASGLGGDAYVAEIGGEKAVVKIAHDNSFAREAVLRSVPVQLWALKKLKMNVPQLIGYDPAGHWMITEFIVGETVKQALKNQGALSQAQRDSIEDLHRKALQFARESYVNFDFAPDNIVLRGDTAYLIDLGPLPPGGGGVVKQDFEGLMVDWEKGFSSPASTHVPNEKLKVRLCRDVQKAG